MNRKRITNRPRRSAAPVARRPGQEPRLGRRRLKTTDFARKQDARNPRRSPLPAWIRDLSSLPGVSPFFRESGRFELLLFLGLLLGGVVVAASGWFAARNLLRPDPAVETPDSERSPAPDIGRMPDESVEEVLHRYMTAERWEDLLPLIRHPDTLRPVMERWYERSPYQPSPRYMIDSKEEGILSAPQPDRFGEKWIVALKVRPDPLSRPRLVPVERVGAAYLVDWECAAGYQSMPFAQYAASRPPEPRYFRVALEDVEYYNFGFEDSRVWRSYRLVEPYSEQAVYGFARRDGPVGNKLGRLFTNGEPVHCILEIRYPDDAEAGVVEITEWKQREWVVVYEEGEAHFDLP